MRVTYRLLTFRCAGCEARSREFAFQRAEFRTEASVTGLVRGSSGVNEEVGATISSRRAGVQIVGWTLLFFAICNRPWREWLLAEQ